MKYVNALAFVAALAGAVACSGTSDDGADGADGAGGTGGDGAGTGGNGPAAGGSGPAAGGSGPAAGGSGTGGGGNPDAVIAECPDQTYTPAADGGTCPTDAAPAVPQIQDFELNAAGWGVYANGTYGTATPAIPTDGGAAATSAGGPTGSTKAMAYSGSGFDHGIRIEAGFRDTGGEVVCQNVKAYEGLSFWAKGTVAAEGAGGWDALANELIIQLPTAAGDYPDKRVTLTADWVEYKIPFDCFGDGTTFGGYFQSILFVARGATFDVSIDQVAYY